MLINSQQLPIVWGIGSREGFVISAVVPVELAKAGAPASSYAWSFIDVPVGSAATILTPTLANASFFIDVEGSYLIKLVIDAGLPSEEFEIVRLVADTSRYALLIPGVGEQYVGPGDPANVPFDITDKGWKTFLNQALVSLDNRAARLDVAEIISGAWQFSNSVSFEDTVFNQLAVFNAGINADDINVDTLDVLISSVIEDLEVTTVLSVLGTTQCTGLVTVEELIANVSLDGPNIVHDDANETITGDWEFQGNLTVATITAVGSLPFVLGGADYLRIDGVLPADYSNNIVMSGDANAIPNKYYIDDYISALVVVERIEAPPASGQYFVVPKVYGDGFGAADSTGNGILFFAHDGTNAVLDSLNMGGVVHGGLRLNIHDGVDSYVAIGNPTPANYATWIAGDDNALPNKYYVDSRDLWEFSGPAPIKLRTKTGLAYDWVAIVGALGELQLSHEGTHTRIANSINGPMELGITDDATSYIRISNAPTPINYAARIIAIADGNALPNKHYVDTYPSHHKAGVETISGANTTAVVAFTTAMPDTNYAIALTPEEVDAGLANVSFYVTNKAVGGFTINISAAPGDDGAGTDYEVNVSWTITPNYNP